MQAKFDEPARKLFGRKSEKLDPNQLALIDLAMFGIEPTTEPEPEIEARPTKPLRRPKRKRPNKDLPRRRHRRTFDKREIRREAFFCA